MLENSNYCRSLNNYKRYKTKTVNVGDVPMGYGFPIRIQSMTTTDTMDTESTVLQSIRMIEAGCEYIRITAPSIKEAKNLQNIKKDIQKRGYKTPIVADIHFTPKAAETAAQIVEKVRINPGNYADKKKFSINEYSEMEYQQELERIYDRFSPLVKICKENGTAMRIGTNHGSLSDRIMNRYGDTPKGMVESALEFLRICEDLNYNQVVLSMKSSNPVVMVQAYRLLVNQMDIEKMNYPLHLGVTEAGEGDDGRIKSSVGIGTLLEDGLGDTIRVSLTEEPEFEIPVAQKLVKRYNTRFQHEHIKKITNYHINPFEYTRRKTNKIMNIGGDSVPVVLADCSDKDKIDYNVLSKLGYVYSSEFDKWIIKDIACDYIFIGENNIDFKLPGTLRIICNYMDWLNIKNYNNQYYPILDPAQYSLYKKELSKDINFIKVTILDVNDEFINEIKDDKTIVLVINTDNLHGMAEQRQIFFKLVEYKSQTPIIIKRTYKNLNKEKMQLFSSTDIGALLVDGLGDGICIASNTIDSFCENNQTAFNILQATRTRIFKTEYISCPSCGRTLFDLQETTAKVRERTNHLKGLKIAIMGCIVNGPGEMADADYGYVGAGNGIINLYKGHTIVKRNIPSEQAVDQLIELIKVDGNWQEPNSKSKTEQKHV